VTEDQIKHMVDRFLNWKLPENFNPDGGISFKKTFNEHTAHPMKHEPVGTNLLSAMQATEMVRHMIEGMDASAAAAEVVRLKSDLSLVIAERDAADEVARTARAYVEAMERRLAALKPS